MTFCFYCFLSHLEPFSKAIGPFLTHPGPRNLPVGSHQIFLWLSNVWETTFWCKNCLHVFFMCLTIIMFCAGFTLFFPLCFPFKLWWFLCYGLFSTVAFYAYFTALLRLILSFIFPWYFPEKSGTFCFIFRHISMDFILFNLFHWIISFSHPFISLIYSFIYSYIIRLFIRIFPYWLSFVILFLFFKLFSCPY